MNRDLTPTEGARFLLERTAESETTATYRSSVFTPTATHVADATLSDDGTVELSASDAPEELRAMLEMQAKLVARGAAKRREDGLPPWPARILRWRGPGR